MKAKLIMRKSLHWEIIYTLKTSGELWIKYKGGETGKKHISQDHVTESACSVTQFAVFNEANVNTFVFFLTVLINPNSETRVLASSIHYVILKSTVIKALEALPLYVKKRQKDRLSVYYCESQESLMAKKTSSYKARRTM